MILGNLYREKGQVGKAITVHQALLQRPKLSRLEHAYVLLCLGLDYKRGGFVDRALEAFNEVLRLDPKNEYALLNLQKLHEEQHQWTEAYDTRQRLSKLADVDSQPQSQAILAFLENEIGLEAMRRKDYREAARRFTLGDRPRRAGGAGVPEPRRRPRRRRERARSRGDLGKGDRGRARPRLPRVRSARGARDPHRQPGSLHAAVPPADRGEPAGLARAPRAVAPPGGERASRARRSTCCSPRWCRTRTRSASTRRSGARSGSCITRRRSSIATASSPSTPSSISTRTSACAAATAARSCSGNARTATTGTRSWRSASRRRRTQRKWKCRRTCRVQGARVQKLDRAGCERAVVQRAACSCSVLVVLRSCSAPAERVGRC